MVSMNADDFQGDTKQTTLPAKDILEDPAGCRGGGAKDAATPAKLKQSTFWVSWLMTSILWLHV